MPDFNDPLAVIAESYRSIVDATRAMTALLHAAHEDRVRLHRFAVRLHAYALTLLGLALLGTGWLVWLMWVHVHP